MSKLHALLIGINYYPKNELPNGLFFKSLHGCVGDVLLVEDFLRTRVGLPAENIIRLTSSSKDNKKALEAPACWPTYENIVNSFKRLTATAKPGDQVFIHYSGHGNRARTTKPFKHLKKLDEVLVPMDIGNSERRYIRDTELHFLLRAMVDRQLIVTLVLDSCFAASATRSWANHSIRRGNKIDETEIDFNSLVAPEKELVRRWEDSSTANTRKAQVGSGWLLEPKGYVLLAACRANEEANEYAFDGKQTHGALTYWMVDALQQIGPGFTYRILHDNILARVHSQFSDQTPELEGEGNRVVFGSGEVVSQRGITVLKLNADGTLLLNAGEAHGLKAGSRFNIFAPNERDLPNSKRSIAQVEITEVFPLQAKAKIVGPRHPQKLQPGSQAMPIEAGPIRLGRRVRTRISRNGGAAPKDAVALKKINDLIASQSGPFISMAAEDEVPDYFVTVNDNDEYVICDAGSYEIPNLRPALSSRAGASSAAVVERLVHLSRFMSIRALGNNSPQSRLARKVVVELLGKQKSDSRDEKPKRFKGSPVVKSGEWIVIRVRNKYSQAVNITVFDLQFDWAIKQIYPAGAGAFETIDAHDEIILPVQMTLPPGYESGVDTIKVFTTIEPTSFRCLELPLLDQVEPARKVRGTPANKLEEFLTAFSPATNKTRIGTVAVNTETLWTAHQVEIEIRS
jgi:hypothetical protein